MNGVTAAPPQFDEETKTILNMLGKILHAIEFRKTKDEDVLKRILDQNDRFIELLEHIATSPAPGAPAKSEFNYEKVMSVIKDGENYMTSEVREILGINSMAPSNEILMSKRVPGKWQKLGSKYFIRGADLKEAIDAPSFRPGG